MQKQERFQGLDYLRAISCIAIIFIHVLSSGFLMYDQELTLAGTVAYRAVLNNLMWAVPCFIMITGALLLNPEKKIGTSKLFSGVRFTTAESGCPVWNALCNAGNYT